MEIRDKRKTNWFWIDKSVWENHELLDSDKVVYASLACFSNSSTQECYPSLLTICQISGQDKRTSIRALKRLEEKGLINIKRTFGKANIYTLLDAGSVKMTPVSNNTTTSDISTPPPVTFQHRVVVSNNTTNNNNINNKEKNKKENSLSSSSESLLQKKIELDKIAPLSPLQVWTIASELNVPLKVVKKTEEQFWEYLKDPIKRNKYKDSYLSVRKWVRMGLSKGYIQEANEIERMDIEGDHPDQVAKRLALETWAKEEGIIE